MKEKLKKNKDKEDKDYSERMRAKLFCCAFKLGFLQLMCKASLIFKSNLVLAILAKLVVILKLGLRNISKRDSKPHIFKHLHSTATF